MDCVRTQQLIRPYLEGILSDRELEEFLDHVEHCQTCFGELEVYFSIYRTLNNVDEKGNYKYLDPWQIKSKDNKIDLTFTPILDRFDNTNLLILKSIQHQVFGTFNGKICVDGIEVEIKDAISFAERVTNYW